MLRRHAARKTPLGDAASFRVGTVLFCSQRVTLGSRGQSIDQNDPFLRELAGRRILLVEDEFLVADDIMLAFSKLGITTVGPASTVSRALSLLESAGVVDAALLDINLRNEIVFPVVEILKARKVPYVFVTGYDPLIIPEKYRDVAVFLKPVDIRTTLEELFG